MTMNEIPVYERVEFNRWDWTNPGEFEWAVGGGEKFLVDQDGLRKEVAALEKFNHRVDTIVMLLLNFGKVFLILPTGEIRTH